jgi:DNA polymerase (family 10)
VVSDLSLVACSSTTKPSRERLGAVSLHVAPPHQIATALLYATGNQQHLAQLESLAQSKGLMLSASGLAKGRRQLTTADETAIYKTLGLPFIPPELREGQDEIELASSRRLPKLVEAADLNGLLHIHTDFSDGVHTLEEMAEAARALGYQYLGISDHSQSAHYAGGLSVEAIEDQHLKIDRLNRGFGKTFRILKGIESDIRVDGSLDYPDEILARFDFVVASVHSQFKMERAKQTARIIAAVSNPFTTILGHPTGRLLLRRPGYQVDIELILKACAEHQVAAEINCNPNRLDLDWRWHRRALKLGCSMSINPDAHSIRELELVKWGVAMARKGGVPKGRVLNSLSQSELLSYLERRAKQSVPKQTVRKRDRRLQRA